MSVVGSDPLVVVDGASDPFAVVDVQPVITGPIPGAVGGGWVGYLGYDLGRLIERLPEPLRRPVCVPSSTLAFYDHLLVRDRAGRWFFEALWSDEHQTASRRGLPMAARSEQADHGLGSFKSGRFVPTRRQRRTA